MFVKITTCRGKPRYASIFMFCVSRCETTWKCTVDSWHGNYSPCCFALTLILWSNYFLYGSLATVFADHSFSTDYGLIEYIMRHIFFKNLTQSVVEKVFPDTFLKNQNWSYLWINSVTFYCYSLLLLCCKLRAIEIN